MNCNACHKKTWKQRLCNSQSAPMNRDKRYDFLLFIGRIAPRCLPDLYFNTQSCSATASYALFLLPHYFKHDQGFPLSIADAIIFSQCDDKSELSGATLCFLPRSKHMQDFTCKFHGSFRLYVFRQFLSYRRSKFLILPYRYFNEFLVLYPDFSSSRQISLVRFPFSPQSLTPLTSMDYSCTAGVYYTLTTRILLLVSL